MSVPNIKIRGTGRFTQSTKNFGEVDRGEFTDTSSNRGVVLSSATFGGTSTNIGSISGTASFGGNATNTGVIQGSAIFADFTVNTGSVSSVTFAGNAVNTGIVLGNASFVDSSTNSGSVSGNVVFYGTSVNNGNIKGSATFNDFSASIGGVITGAFSIPNADTHFKNTVLLLNHYTSTPTNSAFLDSSYNNYTVTHLPSANVTQSSFSPFTANDWSSYFPGINTSYLTLSSSFNANLVGVGTAKTTFEMWVYPTAFAATNAYYTVLLGTPSTGAVNGRWTIALVSNSGLAAANIQFAWSTSTSVTVGVTTTSLGVLKNQWNHIAVVIDPTAPSASTIDIYINGVKSAFLNNNLSTQTSVYSNVHIGGNQSNLNPFTGYISNLRITKNQNLYTSSFTPSYTPLTTVSQGAVASNVLLLTLKNNSIARNMGSIVCPIITTGTVTQFPLSYISYSFGYNPTLVGGSGYFNGSTGKLTIPPSADLLFGADPFTVECWVYPTASVAQATIIRIGNVNDIWIMLDSLGVRVDLWPVGASPTLRLIAPALPINTWNHIALVREGTGANQTKLYVNGINSGTTTQGSPGTFAVNLSSNISNNPASIGTTGNANYFYGYISNLKVTKGAAVYKQAFGPSSFVTSASSNTSFLLNFTNGGIIDISQERATLSTVGDVKRVTNIVKYGSNSLYFDGSGDYLTTLPTDNFNFSTGNFTVEFWVYPLQYSGPTGVGTQLFGTKQRDNILTGYSINLGFNASTFKVISNATGTWADNVTVTANNGPALSAWSHMAVVRNGVNLSIYKNGVSVGSSTIVAGNSFTGTVGIIGTFNDGLNLRDFRGYLADLRVTKGVARYTTTFTPPITSLPVHG